MRAGSGLGQETVEEVVAALGGAHPAPAAGSGLAITLAIATGLVAKCARKATGRMSGAEQMLACALDHQRRALALADEDAALLAALLSARGGGPPMAASAAADPPLAIAELGAEIATAAADLAVGGKPALRGDAYAAALLAEAATRSAAMLVAIDLADAHAEDRRRDRAGCLVDAAGRSRSRADTAVAGRRG